MFRMDGRYSSKGEEWPPEGVFIAEMLATVEGG